MAFVAMLGGLMTTFLNKLSPWEIGILLASSAGFHLLYKYMKVPKGEQDEFRAKSCYLSHVKRRHLFSHRMPSLLVSSTRTV